MPPSSPFVNIPTRQTRLYSKVSEDRMELLLDRFRASMQPKIDWMGSFTSVFTAVAGFVALADSWSGSRLQILLLLCTTVFATVIVYRMFDAWKSQKGVHPMTNQEFLAAFAAEQEEEDSTRSAKIDDASVPI